MRLGQPSRSPGYGPERALRRIAIDMQAMKTPGSRNRGIGQYSRNLLRALFELDETNTADYVLLDLLPSCDPGLSLPGPVSVYRVWTGPSGLFLHPRLFRHLAPGLIRRFLQRTRPSMFLATSPFDAWDIFDRSWYGGIPVLAIVYDLIPLLFPAEYLPTQAARDAYDRRIRFLQQCDHLIAISETVRNDLERLLALPANRITVACGAASFTVGAPAEDPAANRAILRKHRIFKPYIMTTGAGDFRKNLPRLLEAFAGLPKDLVDRHHLVITSHLGPVTVGMIRREGERLGIGQSLVLTGYVPMDELVCLYRQALLFAFPSICEGFGLPVLEAMVLGTPVLTSATAALAEVAGGAAIMVDPLQVASIRQGLRRLIEQPELRGLLARHGAKQAALFTWNNGARALLNAFENASRAVPG